MTFGKAAKIFWRANPYFQITVGFLVLFVTAILWAGSAPPMIWIIIGSTVSALLVGTYMNIRKIKKRLERKESENDGSKS